MAFSFECFAVTHIGNSRKNNEDNFFIGKILEPAEQASMSQSDTQKILKSMVAEGTTNKMFAVSDGMGGHKHGEIASYIVVRALNDFIEQHQGSASRKRQEKFSYIQNFQSMIQETNQRMLDFAVESGERDNMGATLSGLIAFSDEIVPFNIGDSSTFLFEGNTFRKLTEDDNELSILKGIEAAEIESGGKRLTKYFGLPKTSGALTATLSTPIPMQAGQVFIISSDGLTDSLSIERLSEIIRAASSDIAEVLNELLEAALAGKNSGRDNITIVIIKIIKSSKKKELWNHGRR